MASFLDSISDLAPVYNPLNLYPEAVDRINAGEIGVFFVYENVSLLLPINPEDITFSISGKNETRTIITLGDINLLKTPQLETIRLESFFPRNIGNVSQVLTDGRFLPSIYYQDVIEDLFRNKKYFRLVITGYNYSKLVAIENLEWTYQYGDFENLYYSIDIKEYRPYGITLTYDGTNNGNQETNLPSFLEDLNVSNDLTSFSRSFLSAIRRSSDGTNPSDTTQKTIVIGSKVLCSGQAYVDWNGSKIVGEAFYRKRGIISAITRGYKFPYHFIGTGGGNGWVSESAVTLE